MSTLWCHLGWHGRDPLPLDGLITLRLSQKMITYRQHQCLRCTRLFWEQQR